MNVLSKLVTALKAGVTEAGEAIVDSQALRILEQEIRDAEEALNQSKDSLASMIARQKLSVEKSGKLDEEIEAHEGYARKALDKGDEALAMDVAEKLAELERTKALETEATERFSDSADRIRNAILKAEQDLQYMKHQVDTVKATENVQRAEAAVSERHSGTSSKLRTAMESLERIKEKQALAGAQMGTATELANEKQAPSLDQRLEAAGIKETNTASDVLERLKKRET